MPLKKLINLPEPLAERAKNKSAAQKSNAVQKKKQSKPVDTMAVKPVIDSITDVFDKEVLSVL